MNLDKLLSDCKDYHLPICGVMFLIGSVMQWFHHLDMAYVAYAGTILGAITGHSFSPAAKDKPEDKNPSA
jgi:hypothetical protein